MTEHFNKASLVMVKSLPTFVVDGSNIDDYIASVKDTWIACAFDVYCSALVLHHVGLEHQKSNLHRGTLL